MEQPLGSAELRDGARLDISVLETPAPKQAEELTGFYAHKGECWRHHIETALRQPLDALETRFYLGRCAGALITAITTISYRRVGFISHVYTEAAHRGRSACSSLFPAMMQDLRDRGAQALYLGTSFGSTAYRLYSRSGFASRYPDSGEMEWFARSEAEFEAEYFQPGAWRVSPVRWEHWPALNPLTARKEARVTFYGLLDGCFQPLHLEHPFLVLKQGLECVPGWDARVLLSEQDAAAGLATLIPRWCGDGERVLDFLLHPHFAAAAPDLLGALLLKAGPVRAYAAAGEEERIAVLQAAGFRIAGRAPARCAWTGTPPADRLLLRLQA